jgi:hypothetical protein
MEKETDLITSLIINWQKTGAGYQALIKEVSKIIISYPEKRFNWDYDSCVDFYISFYPKLIKLITSFEFKGISFNAILRNTLKWQVRSFYKKHSKKKKIDYCLKFHCMIEAESVSDSAAEDAACADLALSKCASKHFDILPEGVVRKKGLRRQLIMLALKSSYFIDDNYIKKISELSGCSSEWLAESIDMLRRNNLHRKERHEKYNIRISKAYMNLCRIHREIEKSCGYLERNYLDKKKDQYALRLKRATEARNKVNLSPSNQQIAELMELPKGSVDSGLYFLKKILKDFY